MNFALRTMPPHRFLLLWKAAAILFGALAIAAAGPTDADIRINEFVATNIRSLHDEDGDTPDWIELHNAGTAAVDLRGYALTDNPAKPRKWKFPPTNLPPDGYLVVFASGKDRRTPGAALHASFRLAGTGDYLGLTGPSGRTLSEFRPLFPRQLPDVGFGSIPNLPGRTGYLPRPTPGKPNSAERAQAGELFGQARHSPPTPFATGPLTVSVKWRGTSGRPRLYWRLNHQPESILDLNDAGTEGDTTAQDGEWSIRIPLVGAKDGDMVRWRFTVENGTNAPSRWPLHPDPTHTTEYFGTVLNPGSVHSSIPVVHLFIDPARQNAADSEEGARACFFFNGEFHDNVLIKVRGNTTAGFAKKSHRVEFNHEHPFRPPGGGAPIRNTSFMAEWGDPSYLRQHLSFWMMSRAGVPAPFHDPVRLQLNGAFYQLALHSQVLGEELLERTGLDPAGALYKAVGYVLPGGEGSGGFEKKTRRKEPNDDYVAFAQALGDDRTAAQRAQALFDLTDIPGLINYLAVARIVQEDDDIWANMSFYHDNEGSHRWRPVAFDMNVSWGLSFGAGGIIANRDDFRSHPFWGAAEIGSNQGHNRLYDALIRTPQTREMLLRRMRTLLDQTWLPPGSSIANRPLERHIRDLTTQMAPDAALDRQRWGEPWTGRPGIPASQSFAAGVEDLIRQFIDLRRDHLYITHSATNTALAAGVGTHQRAGIPPAQPTDLRIEARLLSDPPAGGLGWVQVTNPHPFAVDVSGWTLGGPNAFTFAPGTVIPATNAVCIVESHRGWERRTSPPMPGSQSIVVGTWRSMPRAAGPVRVHALEAVTQP